MTGGEHRRQSDAATADRLMVIASVVFAARIGGLLWRLRGHGIGKFLFADDAFYYLEIAHNIANGRGSTFDGSAVTNGYHPLWEVACIPLYWVFGAGSATAVTVVFAGQAAMALWASWILFRAFRTIDAMAAAITLGLLLASPAIVVVLCNGMESGLAFLLTSTLVKRCIVPTAVGNTNAGGAGGPVPHRSSPFPLAYGLLLSALCLARLEAGALAGFVLLEDLWRQRRGAGRYASTCWVFGMLALVGLAYIALNFVLVGYPVPISGLVKSSWGMPLRGHFLLIGTHLKAAASLLIPFQGLGHPAIVALALGAQAFGLSRFCRTAAGRRYWPAVRPVFLFWLVFTAAALRSSGGYTWYWWPALLISVLSTFALTSWLRSVVPVHRVQSLAVATASAAIVLSAIRGAHDVRKPYPVLLDWGIDPVLMDRAIAFTRQHIPVSEPIAGHSVGFYGYFLDRDIVHTEGLVNGPDYYRALRAGKAFEAARSGRR